MFVTLGMMYAWATKEYILWEMTWAQVIMYLNEGLEQKFPSEKTGAAPRAAEMSHEELKKKRDELRRMYGSIGGS